MPPRGVYLLKVMGIRTNSCRDISKTMCTGPPVYWVSSCVCLITQSFHQKVHLKGPRINIITGEPVTFTSRQRKQMTHFSPGGVSLMPQLRPKKSSGPPVKCRTLMLLWLLKPISCCNNWRDCVKGLDLVSLRIASKTLLSQQISTTNSEPKSKFLGVTDHNICL